MSEQEEIVRLRGFAEEVIALAAFMDGDAILDDLARRAKEALNA